MIRSPKAHQTAAKEVAGTCLSEKRNDGAFVSSEALLSGDDSEEWENNEVSRYESEMSY